MGQKMHRLVTARTYAISAGSGSLDGRDKNMDMMDQLELELRRLADDLAVLRAILVGIINSLPPPGKGPESVAA
jgi:hypothetical protein